MRQVLVVGALFLSACGTDTPTAPPPLPPRFPAMTGGWGGTAGITQQINVAQNGRLLDPQVWNCSEVWLVNSQADGTFTGTYQRTGTNCADSGHITGTVALNGNLTVTTRSSARNPTCNLLPGNINDYRGVVSDAGNITLQRDFWMACPNVFPNIASDTINYRQTWTLALSRR